MGFQQIKPALGCAFILSANALHAQNFDFVSDYLRYDEPNQTVTLEGEIEISTEYGYFYPETLLYDIEKERIYVDGRLNGVLVTGERFQADYAELDFATQQAILRTAKLVLQEGLQVSAEFADENETYRYGENVVSSSCVICAVNPVPIWQIRAEQVLQDKLNQKIYVKNGFLDLFGVPVFYLPYIRVPAPEVKRLEGFVTLDLEATSDGDSGIKIPYFIPLGEHADLKLTGFLNQGPVQFLEGKYRHYGKGFRFNSDGAISLGQSKEDNARYYFNNNLKALLPYDIDMEANLTVASDYDMQSDYGYSRAGSDFIYFQRIKNSNYLYGEFRNYIPKSAAGKDGEYPSILPQISGEYSYMLMHGLQLDAGFDFLRLDQDLSEDVTRIVLEGGISFTNSFAPGILLDTELGLRGNVYDVDNALEPAKNGQASQISPYAFFGLELPLAKTTANTEQVLTPRLAFAWQENHQNGDNLPNLDTKYYENNPVSLFSSDFYAGQDQRFKGMRGALGLDYGLYSDQLGALEIGAAYGLFDEEDIKPKFINPNDHWLGYINYRFEDHWNIHSAFALDDALGITRVELDYEYYTKKSDFSLEWVWLDEEPHLNANELRSKASFDGRHHFAPNWEVKYNASYDIIERKAFDAGLSLTYGNECIEISAGMKWDLPHKTGTSTETSYALSVDLLGLTDTVKEKWKKKRCSY